MKAEDVGLDEVGEQRGQQICNAANKAERKHRVRGTRFCAGFELFVLWGNPAGTSNAKKWSGRFAPGSDCSNRL